MIRRFATRREQKEYDALTAPRDFADKLTRDLQEVSRDRTIGIY